MSKSKVRFSEDLVQEQKDKEGLPKRRRLADQEGGEDKQDSPEREKKHTLDSDEEDEGTNYQKLDVKKIEGQEDATDEYDGGTKIMAFNMKEDMDEGHFDKDGTFIYNKKDNDIKDAWLDNVNWENVKDSAGKHWIPQDKATDEGKEEEDGQIKDAVLELDIYNRLLELINATETIASSLKRLNSEKGLSAAEERKRRWAAKKEGRSLEDDHSKTVSEITTLADSLISRGHMGAYQLTASSIKKMLNTVNKKPDVENTSFDMFGDALPSASTSLDTKEDDQQTDVNSIPTMWQYRFKEDKSEKLFGPICTSDIAEKAQAGEFDKGVLVRRVGTEGFYDVKRIDFDLYD